MRSRSVREYEESPLPGWYGHSLDTIKSMISLFNALRPYIFILSVRGLFERTVQLQSNYQTMKQVSSTHCLQSNYFKRNINC